MDNLESLKQQWKQTSLRVDALERRSRQTNLDYIASTYRRFVILAAGIVLPGAYALWHLDAPAATPWIYIAVMVIAGAVDFTLWRRTRAINPATMSVSEVAARAAANRRIHLASQLVLLPLAIVFLALMLIGADPYMRGGIICGAIVGGLVGLRFWRRIMRNYRELIRAGRDSFVDLDDTK